MGQTALQTLGRITTSLALSLWLAIGTLALPQRATFIAQNVATSGGGGAIPVTLIQHATQNCGGSQTCQAAAFGSNITTGHDIGVCYIWALVSGTGISLSSVTDGEGDSFTVDAATKQTAAGADYNELGVECAHTSSHVTGGPDQVTCNASAATNVGYCSAWEVTAINASNPDKTAVGTGTMSSGSSPPTTGSVTPTVNGEFIFGATIIDDAFGAGGVFNAGSGFTIGLNLGGGANDVADEYQAQTTAGALTINFTSPGNNGVWVIGGETLKP